MTFNKNASRPRNNRFTHFIGLNLLPALPALYILSFWIMPQHWNEADELDGSWVYALGKFRQLGLSLGKDAWFTYGPVSQWFGPPMGMERYQPWPYYLLGAFVAGLVFFCLKTIFQETAAKLPIKILCVLLFPLFFIANESPEIFLAIGLLLTVCTGYRYGKGSGNWWLYSLMALSGIGLLYKFSFGVLATSCFLIALSYLTYARILTWGRALIFCCLHLALTLSLFRLITGSFDLLTYLMLELELSGKYSELMVYNVTFSAFQYEFAVIFAMCGLMLAWLFSKNPAGGGAGPFLITIGGAVFVLFKHAHVRAGAKAAVYYSSLAPLFVLMAMVLLCDRRVALSRGKRVLVVVLAVPLVVLHLYMVGLIQENPNLLIPLVNNWSTIGTRIAAGVRGEEPGAFARKVANIRSRHAALFSYLNQRGRAYRETGKVPSITFYPWELMYFEPLDGFDFKPPPCLQLYAVGPHTRTHRLDAAFLAAKTRPDMVVIGPYSLDLRSPLNDYTTILPYLFAYYRVAAVIDSSVVLEAADSGKAPADAITCSDTPRGVRGEFFKLTLGELGARDKVLWRLATFLFKSPEMTVSLTLKNQRNELSRLTFRGYVSQLEKGVYVARENNDLFMLGNFRRAENVVGGVPSNEVVPDDTIVEGTAVLYRAPGKWNLPVVPDSLPLQVSYCSFR